MKRFEKRWCDVLIQFICVGFVYPLKTQSRELNPCLDSGNDLRIFFVSFQNGVRSELNWLIRIGFVYPMKPQSYKFPIQIPGMKELQGHIWKEGYASGDLTAE